MDFLELKNNWNEFGKNEAAWAIDVKACSFDGENDMELFYQSGIDDVERLKKEFKFLNVDLEKYHGEGLDFGCGLGRLTQGMCNSLNLENITGVDVSKEMIQGAKKNNKFRNCNYVLNEKADLSIFPDNKFDVIVSMLVLQHIHPRYMHNYIKEFCRILKPNGVCMFNLPDSNINKAFDYIENISSEDEFVLRQENPPIKITVQNCGSITWKKEHSINLGNQYLDSSLNIIKYDDVRVPLSKDIEPGEKWQVAFDMGEIPENASYVSFDMVYEGKFWFAEKGNARLLIPIYPQKVVPIKTEFVLGGNLLEKVHRYRKNGAFTTMEVYGEEKDVVEKICNDAECKFIFASESDEIIPPFSGYRYYIYKNG